MNLTNDIKNSNHVPVTQAKKPKPLPIPLIQLLKTDKQGHIDLEHAIVELVKSVNALIKWAYTHEIEQGIRPRPREVIKKKKKIKEDSE